MSFSIILNGQSHEIGILKRRPHLTLRINGRDYEVRVPDTGDGRVQLLVVNGRSVSFARAKDDETRIVRLYGRTHIAALPDSSGDGGSNDTLSEVHAPMPGAAIFIHVSAGDAVAAGDPIVTIESMKLQTVLGAPRDGIIAEITITDGEMFGKDQILARLVEEEESPINA